MIAYTKPDISRLDGAYQYTPVFNEITFPKGKDKYNCWTRRHIPGALKTMKLTDNTSGMLRHYIGNRKKEHIFINERAGKRLTPWHFEKMIDKWARPLNTQKLQSTKPSDREYHPAFF